VIEEEPPAIVSIDVDGADGGWRQLITTGAEELFDFERAVPMRAVLLREGAASCLLHLHIHHILFDGTSSSVFLRDLADSYREGDVSPTRYHYTDFALWQQEYLTTSAFSQTRDYWRRLFDGSPGPLVIPGDLLGDDDFVGDHVGFALVLPATLDERERPLMVIGLG
jgi:hypothetical protein